MVKGIAHSDLLKSWGAFKEDSLNVGRLGELNATAVRCFNLANWE
ncbi:MAG: hypothetical protein AAF492_32230 [Verrucomicrobiota bacterium]